MKGEFIVVFFFSSFVLSFFFSVPAGNTTDAMISLAICGDRG